MRSQAPVRILVLGATGMLGHKVVQRMRDEGHDVWWTFRSAVPDAMLRVLPWAAGQQAIQHLDALRLERVGALLGELRPDFVVNCLGLIKQRAEASDLLASLTINSFLPHFVAHSLEPWGGRLIHVSTDCVFSGSRGGYSESDPPDPIDLYGKTKALGEVTAENALVLRTSIIGRELTHHTGLLDWFLSQTSPTIKGYRQAIWSGVTTAHLATLIARMIREHPSLSGLFHVSSDRISKRDLLNLLNSAYDRGVKIEADDRVHCDRSLLGTRFEQATGFERASLSAMIHDLVSDPTPYPRLN